MEEEIFSAVSSSDIVKALGIKIGCSVNDLHIYINGVDITKVSLLEEVKITFEKKAAGTGVATSKT